GSGSTGRQKRLRCSAISGIACCGCCACWATSSRGADRFPRLLPEGTTDLTDFSLLSDSELADRIAIVRDNIRPINGTAAPQSGAADEDRNADRLAAQNEELDGLLKEQERRLRK